MENDKIDLRKYINAVKRKWYWGVAVFVLVMGMAITYCVVKMPQYMSYSMMLIEADSDDGAKSMGGMLGLMKSFSIGGFGSASIDNELLILQSHAVKKEMINRLGLNRVYVERNGLQKTLLYKNSPVLLEAPSELFDTLQYGFKVRVKLKKGVADIKATKGLFGTVIASKQGATLPCTLNTPYGDFQVLKTSEYNAEDERTIDVVVQGNDMAVDGFGKKVLEIAYANKKSDGIVLEILDPSKERGRDILNTLMSLYNERRRDRRNERAIADAQFLEERIASLGAELAESEKEIEKFKKDANIISVEPEATLLFTQDVETDNMLLALQVEEMTLNSMLEQLNDPQKRYSLIPMSESLGDANAAAVIENYNDLLLSRMAMKSSAKEGNIALKQLTEQIDAVRESAIENVKRLQNQWEIKYNRFKKESGKYKNRIGSLPQYERELVDLTRDRELKNTLYMFLLEKRESALLKQNNSQELGFVFEPAYSAIKSSKTKLYLILGLGFAAAVVSGIVLSMIIGLRKKSGTN